MHTGESDDAGRVLTGTELHLADQVAIGRGARRRRHSAACPAAIVRGVAFARSDEGAGAGVMPAERDLFRAPGDAG